MKILSFESTCDETAVAVVEDGRKIPLLYSEIGIPSANLNTAVSPSLPCTQNAQ